jgi:hypothetical protein
MLGELLSEDTQKRIANGNFKAPLRAARQETLTKILIHGFSQNRNQHLFDKNLLIQTNFKYFIDRADLESLIFFILEVFLTCFHTQKIT